MSALEARAAGVADTAMLNRQDRSCDVLIYTTPWKGSSSLAVLNHLTAHQRDLKWTFNYDC